MDLKIDMFATADNVLSLQAGERVFQAYDMGAEMYVVLEGQVEITVDSKVLETLGPGAPFGEMALIDQAPRTATATAKTACKLAIISEKRFMFMVQTMPHFALDIMKVMADRLRKMNQRV
jgi:CRP/FNR family transcriptional regulator, cyclic AMP receptor protein